MKKTFILSAIILLMVFSLPLKIINTEAIDNSWTPTIEEVKSRFESERYDTASQVVGDLKVLNFLVDFPDKPNTNINITSTNVSDVLFGSGGIEEYLYPFESITAFYQRSSYGKLKISGDTYG